MPKTLNHTLYCYVESANGAHARKVGRELFGSFSNYVNALISKDRGVKPKLGHWGVKEAAEKKQSKPSKLSAKKSSKVVKKSVSKKSSSKPKSMNDLIALRKKMKPKMEAAIKELAKTAAPAPVSGTEAVMQ